MRSRHPRVLQLRDLETLTVAVADKHSTIVFPALHVIAPLLLPREPKHCGARLTDLDAGFKARRRGCILASGELLVHGLPGA